MNLKIYWGNILRVLRKSHNLTQQDLANQLHLSRQGYSNLECGRVQPSAEDIAILSDLYDVDLYRYAINQMPDDLVAEHNEFKATLEPAKREPRKNYKRTTKMYGATDIDILRMLNKDLLDEIKPVPRKNGPGHDNKNSPDDNSREK